MRPNFWKLSQGTEYFTFDEILWSIEKRLAYVNKDSGAMGQSSKTQAQEFIDAPIGDYFYLTYGCIGIYLIGQLIGPANVFSEYGEGWIDRPFRLVFRSIKKEAYDGPMKWWTPNENSTFTRVPPSELPLFEEYILKPYFDKTLKEYGLKKSGVLSICKRKALIMLCSFKRSSIWILFESIKVIFLGKRQLS
jgi:hypothetical protein